MSTDGVLGGAWLPTDGYLDAQLTYALADGAPRGGGSRSSRTRGSQASTSTTGRCARWRPSAARIEAEVVVNAAGMYAAEIGRIAGIRVPLIPMSHQYLVTQPFRERGEHLPTRWRSPTC